MAAVLCFGASPCWAHAFPDHSDPRVGHTIGLGTEDRSKGDPRVNPRDNTLLEVSLPSLPPGRYQVFWSVIARDGHRTEGHFPFRIK